MLLLVSLYRPENLFVPSNSSASFHLSGTVASDKFASFAGEFYLRMMVDGLSTRGKGDSGLYTRITSKAFLVMARPRAIFLSIYF